jgi:hypothetical protein
MFRSHLTGPLTIIGIISVFLLALNGRAEQAPAPQTPAPQAPAGATPGMDPAKFLNQPLITKIYTADPSAHVFKGRIFVYPSHDIDAGVPPDDLGSHFAMRDYHVLSIDRIGGPVTDHGLTRLKKEASTSCIFRPRTNRTCFASAPL